MEKTFATKGDLDKLDKKLDKKLDEKFDKFKRETIGGVDKMLTKADKVCNKLDIFLEEEKAGTALYKRHDRKSRAKNQENRNQIYL